MVCQIACLAKSRHLSPLSTVVSVGGGLIQRSCCSSNFLLLLDLFVGVVFSHCLLCSTFCPFQILAIILSKKGGLVALL